MDNLLRWGIENSTPTASGTAVTPRKDLDPAIIDYILGKPDAVLMKEALEVALDENQSDDTRVQALDDFEMLVENIDNANDLVKLKMWDPLHSLLTSPKSSENIKMQSLWVIGTAVQNNPFAQDAYLSLGPISTILSFLSPSIESPQLRSKAVYALSGLCKHNAAAVQQLDECGGWDVFRLALEDSNISVRRKTAFLLNSLLIPSDVGSNVDTSRSSSAPVHPNSHASMLRDPSSMSTSGITLKALEDHGLLRALLNALTSPVPHGKDGESEGDPDFEEKVVQLLCTYLSFHSGAFPIGVVPKSDIKQLKRYLDDQISTAGGVDNLREVWGLSDEEFNRLSGAVKLD